MSLRRRAAAAGLLTAVVLLAGCTVAASREGQERVDAAIASAGLTGQLEATYSCSGALPGRVDSCQTRVAMRSDDRSLIEKAAAIPELQGAPMELHYRGATVVLRPEDLPALWKIFDALGVGVTVAGANIEGADQPNIRFTRDTPLASACAGVAALAPDFVAVFATGEFGAGEWRLTVDPGQDLTAACAQVQNFLDGADLTGVRVIEIQQSSTGQQLIDVWADGSAAEAARAWFAEHPLPTGMEVRIS